jgi:O-antigen ligase
VGAPPRTRQAPGSFQIDRPLLGLGFGRVVDYTWEGRFYRVEGDPDNSFVYILAGGGALALASFLLLMGAYVRDALRRLRETSDVERSLIVWALSAWFIVMVNCAMAPFLPRSKIVLTLWALLLLPALVRRSDESSAERQD